MEVFEFDNIRIHYKLEGSGIPVLFLHGFLEDHSIWDVIIPSFGDYQIITIDLPGHGQTEFQGEKCDMSYMARLIEALLKKLRVENPFVFGHSMGGYVGLELLKLRPVRLILVHSNFWADSEEKKSDRNRVIEVVKMNHKRFVREAIPGLFYHKNAERCEKVIQNLIVKAEKMDPKGIVAATAGMRDRVDNSALMNSHDIKIIHGNEDPIIKTEALDEAVSALQKSPEIFYLENTGHMGMWEDTSGLIKHIKTIINQ